MTPIHLTFAIPIALLAFVFSTAVNASAADFSLYPAAARPCLYEASNATSCDTTSVPKYNACVCGNGDDFLENSSKCIAQDDSSDVDSVYNTLDANCRDSNTPISVNFAQWRSWAASASAAATTKAVSSTASPTASETSSPTGSKAAATEVPTDTPETEKHDDNKLGTTGIVGIAVGVPIFVALVGVIFALWRWRQRKQPYTAMDSPTASPYVGAYDAGAFANSPSTSKVPFNSLGGGSLDHKWDPSPQYTPSQAGPYIPQEPIELAAAPIQTHAVELPAESVRR